MSCDFVVFFGLISENILFFVCSLLPSAYPGRGWFLSCLMGVLTYDLEKVSLVRTMAIEGGNLPGSEYHEA